MILSGVINMKPLLILSLLFILAGCGDSEVAEENNNEIYQQRAYARYDEAIDQEYPCQDPVADIGMEKLIFLNKMFYCEPEIYGGSGPQNNVDPEVCKDYAENSEYETLTNLVYKDGANEYESIAIANGLTDVLNFIFEMWLTDSHFIYGDYVCGPDCRQDLNFEVNLPTTSFDLNDDGAKEVFVILNHSLTCGSSGCDTYILQGLGDDWKIIYNGKEIRRILAKKTNDYYLIYDMSKYNDYLCSFNKIEYECKIVEGTKK